MLKRMLQVLRNPAGFDCRRCGTNRVSHPMRRCAFCENVAVQIEFGDLGTTGRLHDEGRLFPPR